MTTSTTPTERSSWRSFFDAGGFWRALLLAAVYWAVYILGSRLLSVVLGGLVDGDDPLGNAVSSFVVIISPIILGILVLVVFVRAMGWWDDLFGPQPIRGSWWMWILPLVVVVTNLLRYVATDYSQWSASNVVVILLSGLFIGFAEELLTRGIAVDMLRRAGHGEWSVAVLSSLIFALLHAGNVVSGMAVRTVAITVVYTFFFGLAMYLTLRVTGNLIWPILLHAMTDPSAVLLTGGIDVVDASASDPSMLFAVAMSSNIVVMAVGLVFVWFIRGKVDPDAHTADTLLPA